MSHLFLNRSDVNNSSEPNTQLQIFQNADFGEIRTFLIDDEPWFCLADVCRSLGIKDVSRCKSRLNAKGVRSNSTLTKGGFQELIFIDEPNLYKCVFQSRKPQAEGFQDWISSDVLPTIRKTGSYSVKPLSQLEIIAQSAQILLEQDQKIKEIADKQESLQEKVQILEAKATTRPNYFTIVGYATLHKIECGIKLASSLGRKASDYCKRNNIATESIPDPRFGLVKTYPTSVLDVIFNTPLN